MNRVVIRLVLLVLGITLLSSSIVAQQSLPKSVDDEEYAVYSALIETYTLQHRPSSLLISKLTITPSQKSLRPIRDSQVEATTVKDFLSKNDRLYPLTDRLRLSFKYQFSKEAERVYAAPAGMLVIQSFASRVQFQEGSSHCVCPCCWREDEEAVCDADEGRRQVGEHAGDTYVGLGGAAARRSAAASQGR